MKKIQKTWQSINCLKNPKLSFHLKYEEFFFILYKFHKKLKIDCTANLKIPQWYIQQNINQILKWTYIKFFLEIIQNMEKKLKHIPGISASLKNILLFEKQ